MLPLSHIPPDSTCKLLILEILSNTGGSGVDVGVGVGSTVGVGSGSTVGVGVGPGVNDESVIVIICITLSVPGFDGLPSLTIIW